MANTLGITEATLAEARDSTAAVNLISARPDQRWNQVMTIRVTDHADDGGVILDETEEMALFVSKGLGHPWRQANAKRGHQVMSAGKDAATDPVLFPVPAI